MRDTDMASCSAKNLAGVLLLSALLSGCSDDREGLGSDAGTDTSGSPANLPWFSNAGAGAAVSGSPDWGNDGPSDGVGEDAADPSRETASETGAPQAHAVTLYGDCWPLSVCGTIENRSNRTLRVTFAWPDDGTTRSLRGGSDIRSLPAGKSTAGLWRGEDADGVEVPYGCTAAVELEEFNLKRYVTWRWSASEPWFRVRTHQVARVLKVVGCRQPPAGPAHAPARAAPPPSPTPSSTGGRSTRGGAKFWVDTFRNAAGYSSPGGARTGTLFTGTHYVFCKKAGPTVRFGNQHNTYWLKTDLDAALPGKPWRNQWVSAYYLKRWGNDIAKDNSGRVIPDC